MSATETPASPSRRASLGSTEDLLVLSGAVLLCVGFAPAFVSAPFSPRFALLLGFLPIGLVALTMLCLRRDLPALAAAGFIIVAIVSAILSNQIRVSLVGQLGKESSALLLAAFFGCWALGRRLTERGRQLLPYALLVGFGFNALVGFLQIAFPSASSQWTVPKGQRALGLTANPVQLGALMAGGVALCAVFAITTASSRWRWWALGVGAFAAAANVSGTRIALISIGAVLVGLLIVHRSWRRTAVLAIGVVVGVVSSSFLLQAASNSQSATTRATSSFDRTDAWIYGLQSFLHRPLLGYGAGAFRPATQHRYSAAFVRTAAFDELHSAWFDAHNVLIEFLVATGIIGVALLAVFAWSAIRSAGGPLLATFVAIALTWTMQPMSVSDAPIAFLALGAAAPVAALSLGRARHRRLLAASVGVAAVTGLALGGAYAVADLRLQAAVNSGDALRIEHAARWFGNDAVVADIVAQGWANAFVYDGADKRHVQEWAQKIVQREPDRPYWWSKLASTQMTFGDNAGARTSLDRALALQPWSPTAWPLMLALAQRTHDPALEATAHAKVCALGLKACHSP